MEQATHTGEEADIDEHPRGPDRHAERPVGDLRHVRQRAGAHRTDGEDQRAADRMPVGRDDAPARAHACPAGAHGEVEGEHGFFEQARAERCGGAIGSTSRITSGETGSLKVRTKREGASRSIAPSAGSLLTRVAWASAAVVPTASAHSARRTSSEDARHIVVARSRGVSRHPPPALERPCSPPRNGLLSCRPFRMSACRESPRPASAAVSAASA